MAAKSNPRPQQGVLPITTKSLPARQLYEGALVKMQNMHGPQAMQDLRQAAKLDPDFAMANIMISFASVDPTVDPAEQVSARDKANAARSKVGHGEQLVIDWLTDSSEGKMIPAIQAMNEVLDEYQNDKFLAWLGAVWVENQQEITRAIPMFERAIRLNPDFAPPLNELGYCYARVRNFDKAFAAMQRYVFLLPNESNPQDSYAEILRMAGKFDQALAHYHASLKIDPAFVFSQVGIADTYALMGDGPRARAEYAIAIQHANSKMEDANWRLQSAITYIRENNYAGADAAFRAAARQAHDNDLVVPEAEAYRIMSSYQTDHVAALELLLKAEEVLQEEHFHKLPKTARQEELALVLRQRVVRAVRAGDDALAAASLKRLLDMAETTHDRIIQIAYDGAAGALLMAQGKYEDALAHLEEDDRNPESIKLMVLAYQKTGANEHSEQLAAMLANWNEPTPEQALVVPEFRAQQTDRTVGRLREDEW
ncbi:MAG TPA: tetratricopeptide repeat protein [Candidatus Saccharimonadales bacterium]|nr:tetratricopeptide repeat protein [Candidatus Saccharimonadales bacterium]